MANYVINSVGSSTVAYPNSTKKNDTWEFNITNSNQETSYTGTILKCVMPFDCRVKIEAYGARGSYGNLGTSGLTALSRSGNGAYVYGTFDFTKNDELLILVGQHGRDAMTGAGSGDQVTGAGGGGTFVVKKSSTSTGYTMVGNSINGSNVYSGWYLTPLIIAAGGNGSRDNGYSGTGTIYGGQVATGTAPSYTSYSGGGFSGAAGTTSSNSSSYTYGLSFLYGGLGSQYYYTRTSYAKAGFGCGASNTDDSGGGGGGGYYGGLRDSRSATSYNVGSDAGGTSDNNAGDGLLRFSFIEVPGAKFYVRNGSSWIESSDTYAKYNGVWSPVSTIYAKNDNIWKEGV